MFPKINTTIEALDITSINADRQKTLQPLIDFIQSKVVSNETIRLNFICTHNSRRSHLGQIWAQTLAFYYNIDKVFTYSGGTESTALFLKVSETLQGQGFEVAVISETKNPIYSIKYSENENPIIGFSKTYDAAYNPKSEFAAILTCSSADVGCPFISGAEKRIPVTYNDPKQFDNTPYQNEKYLERSLEISTELKYVFSKINLK